MVGRLARAGLGLLLLLLIAAGLWEALGGRAAAAAALLATALGVFLALWLSVLYAVFRSGGRPDA